MESFASENRIVYTDLSINAKVFVPTKKMPKTSTKLSVNAKEYFPLTDNSNVKEPKSRFMKNPYKNFSTQQDSK
jgi:hypothetical protein